MAEVIAELLTSVVIVALFVIVAISATKLIARAIRRYAQRTFTDIHKEVIPIITVPLGVGIVLVGLNLSLINLEVMQTLPALTLAISKGFPLAWTLLAGWTAYRIVGSILDHLAHMRRELYPALTGVVKPLGSIIRLLIAVSVLLTILGIAGVDIAPYVLGWGLLGFAIVLALQPVLQDFFSGLYVSLTQPYKVGDTVQLPSGEVCEVSDIKAQHTLLYNLVDKVFIKIPNTDLMKMRIVSPEQSAIRLSIPFKITQDSSVELAKKVAHEILEGLPEVAERPNPNVYVTQLNGSTVSFELVCWVENPGSKYDVVDKINMQLIRRFKEEGIKFSSGSS